jgi:hypothetical protein
MEYQFAWRAVLEAVAKLTAATSLFAYLLRRGGLRPAAVIAVTLAHVTALFFLLPMPPEFVFMAILSLGTCSYAVLAVDRPWLRTGIVVACFVTSGTVLAQASARLAISGLTALAVWSAIVASMRDWARAGPKIHQTARQ